MTFGQTTEYSGIVKSKDDKSPLLGITVVVKGTKISTQTNIDGHFKINVPDSLNVLSFYFIGYQPKDYKLTKKTFLEIYLKEDCTICFLDREKIGIYAQSGLVGNPLGIQFDLSSPAFFGDPTLKMGFGYQTNFRENRFLNAYVNLVYLFMNCGFSIEINSSIRNLNSNNNIDSNSYSLATAIDIYDIKILAGISNVKYIELDIDKTVKTNGLLIGIETWFGPPFYASVLAQTSIYENLSEYQVEIKRDFERFSTFARYNRIGSFSELSLGIGYKFTY